MELLELVGLDPSMADRYPAQLSGGQQQRVGVARALAADPPVLLMDEPFGAVDPIVRAQLQREFARLQRELGKTVVFVTHDVDEAISSATASPCSRPAAGWPSWPHRRSCSPRRRRRSSPTSSAAASSTSSTASPSATRSSPRSTPTTRRAADVARARGRRGRRVTSA